MPPEDDKNPAPLPPSTKQLEARIAALEEKKGEAPLTAEERELLKELREERKAKPAAPPAPKAPTEGKATSSPSWPW